MGGYMGKEELFEALTRDDAIRYMIATSDDDDGIYYFISWKNAPDLQHEYFGLVDEDQEALDSMLESFIEERYHISLY